MVTVSQVRIAVSSFFFFFFSKRSALRTLFHNIVYHLHLKTDLSGKLWHFSTEWPLYPLQFLALPRWLNFQPSLVMIDISAWIASELGLSFKQSWDGHPSELSTVLSFRSYPEVFIQNLHVRCFVTIFLIKAAYLVIILVQYNLSNLVCNIKSPRPYIHLINPCSSFLLWRLALQEAQNKSVIYMKWPAVVIGANTYCLFCSEIMMGAWSLSPTVFEQNTSTVKC